MGDGVSFTASPSPRALDDETVAWKSGVEFAERVPRKVFFCAAPAVERRAGGWRLRGGFVGTVDSSPLEDAGGRLLRADAGGVELDAEGPCPCWDCAPCGCAAGWECALLVLYAPRMGLVRGSKSAKSRSGENAFWKTRFAGAECGAAGSMCAWCCCCWCACGWADAKSGISALPPCACCGMRDIGAPLLCRIMGETKSGDC